MRYRAFGRTDWQVSEIGFGGWQLGGTWGDVNDQESIRTLLYAFENGINLVDTAVLYGPYRSEKVVGKALKQWTDNKIYVATKIPPVVWPEADDENASMRGRYPDWHLREQVEGSLRRLQVERIDLLQLHGWIPRGTVELDWLETLNDLRLQGKIDQIGVSLRDIRPSQGIGVARLGLVTSIQVMFNIFEQEPMDDLFPSGQENETAFIARVPFDSGALTGTWDDDTYSHWAEDDKRYLMYRGDRFRKTLARVRAIEAVCQPYYESLAEAAMRFCLHHPAVSIVIPGMRDKREVTLNIAYSNGESFPDELSKALRPHAWKHEFYQ
jgi:aryl-alcohol dehydrogenase-like predicted oxidoreductase